MSDSACTCTSASVCPACAHLAVQVGTSGETVKLLRRLLTAPPTPPCVLCAAWMPRPGQSLDAAHERLDDACCRWCVCGFSGGLHMQVHPHRYPNGACAGFVAQKETP